jgi:hypothetical protein
MEGCQMGFTVAIGPEIVRRCFPSLHGIQRKSEKGGNEKNVPGKICKQVKQHFRT